MAVKLVQHWAGFAKPWLEYWLHASDLAYCVCC